MKKIMLFSNLLERKLIVEKRQIFSILILSLFLSSGVDVNAFTLQVQGQSTRSVTGKVVDAVGVPLSGVNVIVENTQKGVQTDFDGKFEIFVTKSEKVLVFSYIGFEESKIDITNLYNVNITLIETVTVLDKVVVTGYQTISKERATGSFVKIDSDQLSSRPVNNLIDQLEGFSSGLNVSSSGEVQIRGVSTIFANSEPLYVIDGFPVNIPLDPFFSSSDSTRDNLATINPEDIESVTILKDASAASIWGVRASNGVIVITTKKGKKNQKLQVQLSSVLTIEEKIDYSKQDWANTSDVIDMKLEAISKGWVNFQSLISRRASLNLIDEAEIMVRGLAPDGDVWSQSQYDEYINKLRDRDLAASWEEHLLRQPIRQTYNLSVSGGSENNTFYASMVYNDNKSHSIGNSDDRIILNMQDTYRLNDKFKFTAGITTTLRNSRLNGVNADGITQGSPYLALVDENGQTIQYYNRWNRWVSQEREALTGIPYSTNQLDTQRARDQATSNFDVRAKFGVDYNILCNLKFTSSFQYEKGTNNFDRFDNMDLPQQRILINDLYTDEEGYQIPLGTQYLFSRRSYKSWNLRNTLTWDHAWNKHDLTVFAGAEVIRRFSDYTFNKIYGYDKQTTTYVPVNDADFRSGVLFDWNGDRFSDSQFYDSQNDDEREFSVFANVGYEFDNKYSLNASFRIDQKNLFGNDPDFRYKPLWSVGIGWNMDKEDFMENVIWVNRLRLRTTYGLSGNANNRFSPFAQAQSRVEARGTNLYDFLRLTQPANDKLKWEETTTYNFAVDFSLFNSKLNGSIEYYKRWSDDLLGNRELDVTNGWQSGTVNYASIENSGVELDLNCPIIGRGDFRWNANINLSYNENVVTNIEDQLQRPGSIVNNGKLAVGSSLNNLYSYNYAGLDQFGHPLVNAGGTPTPWQDLAEGDVPLEEGDLIFHGNTVAPYYGGLRNTFTYKNFDLAVNVTFKFGHVFRRNPIEGISGGAFGNFTNKIWVNRWQQPGDEARTRVPAMAYNGQVNPLSGEFESRFDNIDGDRFFTQSQDFVYAADFVRIRDIVLGYNLPQSIMKKTFFQNLRINANVQNPFLWVANDEGYDPEAAFTRAYTNLRTYTIGIKATF